MTGYPDLLALGLAPFIYFGQHHRSDSARELDRPFLQRAFGLWYQVDGVSRLQHRHQTHTIRPGQVAITEPGVGIRVGRQNYAVIIALDLVQRERRQRTDGSFALPAEGSQPSWEAITGLSYRPLVPDDEARAAGQLIDLCSKTYWIDDLHHLETHAMIAAWLCRHIRRRRAVLPYEVGGQQTRDSLVERIDDYIRTQYSKPITVSDVARAFGLSRSHLERHFPKKGNITPGALLQSLRMERARRKLASGEESIAFIADDVGYRSASAFIAAFRRVHGCTPGPIGDCIVFASDQLRIDTISQHCCRIPKGSECIRNTLDRLCRYCEPKEVAMNKKGLKKNQRKVPQISNDKPKLQPVSCRTNTALTGTA